MFDDYNKFLFYNVPDFSLDKINDIKNNSLCLPSYFKFPMYNFINNDTKNQVEI